MNRHLEDLKYFLSKDAPAKTRSGYRLMVASWIFTILLTTVTIVMVVTKAGGVPLCYLPIIPDVICIVMSITFLIMAMKD